MNVIVNECGEYTLPDGVIRIHPYWVEWKPWPVSSRGLTACEGTIPLAKVLEGGELPEALFMQCWAGTRCVDHCTLQRDGKEYYGKGYTAMGSRGVTEYRIRIASASKEKE